uniref:ABC transporter domain-containing protein n=1 Tax=viral metagenome TaxID=1070528 RepID=A0A6C0J1X4_9ZZZZ
MHIAPYLPGLKRHLFMGFIYGMTSSYLLSYVPIFYTKIMECLIKNNKDDIYNYLIIYYVYNICGNIFAGLRGYIFTIYIQILSERFKKGILYEFFKKDVLYFNNLKPNEVANILINDSNSVSDLYCLNANIAMRNLSQFITLTYILFRKSKELYFLNLGLAFIELLIEHNYHHFIYEKSVEKCNKLLLLQNGIINDYINKIDTYKSLGLENMVYNNWNKNKEDYLKIKKTEATVYGIKVFINQSINKLMILSLITYGIWKKYPFDEIMVFLLYNPTFCSILNDMMLIRTSLTNNKIPLKNINGLFKKDSAISWDGSFIPDENKHPFKPDIIINNLTFYYDESKVILDKLNLKFEFGKIIGISGQSGKGKSTLLKLLLGLYKPVSGDVLYDYIKIYDIDKEYFYKNLISFVGQEPVLFSGSTHENIVSNIENYDSELFDILKDLIEDVPMDTKMSGGQRQRVAICRAFMRKPKILLLDEPTSALDVENEKMVLDIIQKLHKLYGITIIIVSHKKTTMDICDKIVYM